MLQNNDNRPKAVIYARVSSIKQVQEGHGLSSQETRCREFARNRGYEVLEVFSDEGVTGKLLERKQMQAMLTFLRTRKRKNEQIIVLIDDISRLARDVEAHIQLRGAISEAGGKLESPSIEFGDDSDSRLVEHLLASVAAHQREKNAEQVKNRMRARALNGYWITTAPVGYRYEKVEGHGKLLVRDEPIASIVEQALKGFAYGRFETLTEVKNFLESHTVFPRGSDGKVHVQRAADMLAHVIYSGRLSFPKWNIHNHPAKHEGLITFEEWTKIQQRLKGRATAPARKDLHQDFPLRGFVTCSCCDAPLTSCWTKGRSKHYGYYLCYRKGCDLYGKSIKKELIESAFEELLHTITPPKAIFDMAKAMFKEHWEARSHGRHKEIFTIKQEKTEVERKISQLLERIVDTQSQSVLKTYEQKIEDLEQDKAVLDEKIAQCGQKLPSFTDSFRTAMELLSNPHKLWASGDLVDQRNVLRLCFGEKLSFDKNGGFRTASKALPVRVLDGFKTPGSGMVEPSGIEPLTSTLPVLGRPNIARYTVLVQCFLGRFLSLITNPKPTKTDSSFRLVARASL